ncbi:MAG: zinc-ribbon domain-containing protein [Anaerolineales bacterium]|nr:zinc-ribbon domain-containing protein [Anaerolineales bacterium]
MNCSNCGIPNQAGARFCSNCGAPLQAAYPQVPQPVSRTGGGFPWGALVIGLAIFFGIIVLAGILFGGMFLFGSGMLNSGPAPTQQVIVVVPNADTGAAQPGQQASQTTPDTSQLNAPAAPTNTPEPSTTATLGAPAFTADKDALCRKGPSTIYDVRTSMNKGDTVPIIGKSGPEWEEWWLVEVLGSKCWIWSGLGQAHGDLNGLQVVQAPPTPTATVVNAKMTITNNFIVPICYVYLYDVNNPASGWSTDILGPANTIAPGKSYTLTGITPGTYNISVSDCNNSSLDTKSNVQLNGIVVVNFP